MGGSGYQEQRTVACCRIPTFSRDIDIGILSVRHVQVSKRPNMSSQFLHHTVAQSFRTNMYSTDYAVARCLSACLSHAGIMSKRLNVSSNFFSPWDSHTILVFPYQTLLQHSDEVKRASLTGAWNAGV